MRLEQRSIQKSIVMDFIKEHFQVEDLIIESFDVLPGGIKITDRNNDQMVFYYDWNTEEVKYMFPDKL